MLVSTSIYSSCNFNYFFPKYKHHMSIAIFTVYKQFFWYLNLPTTEQNNSLFRQPINLTVMLTWKAISVKNRKTFETKLLAKQNWHSCDAAINKQYAVNSSNWKCLFHLLIAWLRIDPPPRPCSRVSVLFNSTILFLVNNLWKWSKTHFHSWQDIFGNRLLGFSYEYSNLRKNEVVKFLTICGLRTVETL